MATLKRFITGGIGRKIMAAVGIVVGGGLVALVLFYAQRQEDSILAQQERALLKVTESVLKGLRTVMLAGYADVGHAFFDRLRGVGDSMEIRILRVDGSEAFRDNATVDAVNGRLAEQRFHRRSEMPRQEVMAPDHPRLRQALTDAAPQSFQDGGFFTLLMPVTSEPECRRCHGSQNVRAVLKVTTALAPIQADIRRTRLQSLAVLGIELAGVLLCVNLLVRRTLVTPIRRITAAMERASHGDLTQEVPVVTHDELGQMASSFNRMIRDLLRMYSGLKEERNKLSTIVLGAGEGIVVTDGSGRVVLVNPAAERLLGKPAARITSEGLPGLLDDPAWMEEQLAAGGGRAPCLRGYGTRTLAVQVGRIADDEGRHLGCAALLRDVTEETQLRHELQRQSDTDALTGLYNRRFFDARLADELALARRYPHALSLFVLDVDHFKKFNDTYGHDQGDRVLQAMGAAMRECAGKTEVVCRYGGEEFVCILPGANREAAMAAAERLRAHVEALEVDGLRVTISIGIATYPDLPVNQPDELLKAADTALYAAKEGGRNCVRAVVTQRGCHDISHLPCPTPSPATPPC